ncbi:HlyD family type I secretion periplasmic adaptor subunit [Vreelandella utahensis]|uniref:HlyD family type I secretion periplasmic adaptor subunit n=1 Tax=Vreelandella halophila TaxID=86177 RepID=UPI00098493A5|nr:HlyD family type I secretion periplasmic adaptor subunit [Halomonas utahensis]
MSDDRKGHESNSNNEGGDKPVSSRETDHSDEQENGAEAQEWQSGQESGLPGEYIEASGNENQSSDQSMPTDTRRRVGIGIIVLLITFVGLGGWAALAPLHGAAVATGQVVIDSENRVVQHLEGGIVSSIHVQEGDRVEKGEVLVQLSETKPRSELSVVESQLMETLGREARLLAERIDADRIEFPEELRSRDTAAASNIIEGQRALFETRRESFRGQAEIYDQNIQAFRQQIEGLRATNETLESRIQSVQEELENWTELHEQELADRTRINEMQRKLFSLKGEKLSNESQIAELKVKIGTARTEKLVHKEDYKEKVAERLRETQQKKADLQARRVALRDTLKRTTITAPDNGTVVGMTVFTPGAIVKAGDTLMEIVPNDQEKTINARVKPQDIDRVEVGQKADVRLSAFNQQSNQLIEGELVRVSADSFKDEQSGERYFDARVRITEEGRKTMRKQAMFLTPGMPAEVMIKTGERTALQYLLAPVTRMLDRAFREE